MGVKIFIPLEAQARLSFEELGEPARYQDDPKNKPRWASTFLVPYGNPFVKKMEETLEQLAKASFGKNWKAIFDEVLLDKKGCCWIDGKRKSYNGYEGHWALTAYRDGKDGRPLVLDNDGSPMYDSKNQLNPGKAGRLFGGCFVRGEVELWPQLPEKGNGAGLRAGLLQVQRVKKGDAFGGASAPVAGSLGALADDDEDDLEEDLG